MTTASLDSLTRLLSRLPGIGNRSARRIALHLLRQRDSLMLPLADALRQAAEAFQPCSSCGNLDTTDPCGICENPKRDAQLICVVEDLADLWAMERAGIFRGQYHVLGGTLSAIDGRGPQQLQIPRLVTRIAEQQVREVILATNATVEGHTTAHYLQEQLAPTGIAITRLAQGIPFGGELDYMDEGTLGAALQSRIVVDA